MRMADGIVRHLSTLTAFLGHTCQKRAGWTGLSEWRPALDERLPVLEPEMALVGEVRDRDAPLRLWGVTEVRGL